MKQKKEKVNFIRSITINIELWKQFSALCDLKKVSMSERISNLIKWDLESEK